MLDELAEEKLPEKEDVPPVVQNADPGETGSEVSVVKQLAEKLEKESTAADESSRDSRWEFANRNRSNPYLIDRKLRRKIAEKKQLHGLKMG